MEHLEREKKLRLIAKLLRVRCYIKDMKDETMPTGPLQRLQVAFMDMMRLRDVLERLEEMEYAKAKEGPREQYRRYTNIYLKNHLIEKIETAISYLEGQTNLLSTRSGLLSILSDLERATLIFRTRAMNYVAVLPDRSAEESVVDEKRDETVGDIRGDGIDEKQADTAEEIHSTEEFDGIQTGKTDGIQTGKTDGIQAGTTDDIHVDTTAEKLVDTAGVEEGQADATGVDSVQADTIEKKKDRSWRKAMKQS